MPVLLADTPIALPLLAQREAAIRFVGMFQYRDRQGRVQPVDWVVAMPGYHTPLAPVFSASIAPKMASRASGQLSSAFSGNCRNLKASGDYRLVHCHGGLCCSGQLCRDKAGVPMASSWICESSCPWLGPVRARALCTFGLIPSLASSIHH